MSLEDKALAMHVRKMIVKTPLDITMLNVTCRKGSVELTGSVKRPNDHAGAALDMRSELKKIIELARNTRGVIDVHAEQVKIAL